MADNMMEKMNTLLVNSRNSELSLQGEVEGLKDLMDLKQQIIQEMNSAVRLAMEKAKEPFLERLKEVDEQYALILALTGTGPDNE